MRYMFAYLGMSRFSDLMFFKYGNECYLSQIVKLFVQQQNLAVSKRHHGKNIVDGK